MTTKDRVDTDRCKGILAIYGPIPSEEREYVHRAIEELEAARARSNDPLDRIATALEKIQDHQREIACCA